MRRITESASLSDTATVMCKGADVMKESCDTYEWVMVHTYEWAMAHIWMSYGTNMNESWHKYEWVMAQIWMSRGTNMNDSWYAYEWVVSHRTYYLERRQLWCARGRMWWRSHLTHMNESWGTCEWVMAHVWMSHVTQNSLLRDKATVMCEGADLTNESCHTYEWVMVHTWMSHGTRMNESRHTELITER